MVTRMTPRGHMATLAQRLNDTRPYHDHWQDDSRSVSRPTNSSMVRTTNSFITKRYKGLFRTIYMYIILGWVSPLIQVLLGLTWTSGTKIAIGDLVVLSEANRCVDGPKQPLKSETELNTH